MTPCIPLRLLAGAALAALLLALAPPAHAASQPPTAATAPDQQLYQGHSLAQLQDMLVATDPKQRTAAVVALREAGAAALPIFVWAFNDEDPAVRIAAVKSLGPLGSASQPAVSALADLLLVDPITAVRTQIIATLSQIGPHAADAVPALRRLQREADLTTRVNASQALDRILAGQRP